VLLPIEIVGCSGLAIGVMIGRDDHWSDRNKLFGVFGFARGGGVSDTVVDDVCMYAGELLLLCGLV